MDLLNQISAWRHAGYNIALIGHHDNDDRFDWAWKCDIRKHFNAVGSISSDAIARMQGQYVNGFGDTPEVAIRYAINAARTLWPDAVKEVIR